MESSKWRSKEEEREVMEVAWIQVQGACAKLKKRDRCSKWAYQENTQRNGWSLLLMKNIEGSYSYDDQTLETNEPIC